MILYVCAECGAELLRIRPLDDDCNYVWSPFGGGFKLRYEGVPSPRDLKGVRCPRCGTVLNGAAAGLAVE